MNSLGYEKIRYIPNSVNKVKVGTHPLFVEYCPWPNKNPNTMFGRFATKHQYYQMKKE